MNIESLRQSLKAAMPDASKAVHDFYLEIIDTITPKQESFTQAFDGRGEANYTMVYHPVRIRLDHEDDKPIITPNLETGLLYMRGTDGSIAIESIRNNHGLPTRDKTMTENVNSVFQRHQQGVSGEAGMRYVAHGIARHQFGNVHDIQMSEERAASSKAVPEPYIHGKGFGTEMANQIHDASGLFNGQSSDSLAVSLYLKSLFDVDSDMSEIEKQAHLRSSGKHYNIEAFFTPKTLTALNGNDPDDAALYQRQLQLAEDVRTLVTNAYREGAYTQFQPVEDLLKKAASHYPSDNPIDSNFDQFAMEHYPAAMINFIVTGQGDSPTEAEKVRAHRKLFLEAMAQEANIDWFSEIQQEQKSTEMTEFLSKLRSIVDENKRGAFAIEQIMSHVDNGKIPRTLISQQHGVDYISKKHFRQALQNTGESLEHALALAKLPDIWFAGEDKFYKPLDIRHISPYDILRVNIGEDGERNDMTLYAMGYNKIKPYLIRTGKELGRLDSRLQQATQSGNPEHAETVKLQVNKEKKVISQQYAWLSKKPDAVDAIMKLNDEYQLDATLGDYERTMNIFLEALAKRAAYDLDGSDALEVDDEGRIEIDTKHISHKLMSTMEEAERDYRLDLDSDHRDYDDEEIFIDPVEVDDFGRLFDKCWSVKSAAENNDRLHKSMSSISKILGEYSSNNVEWQGLIDAPAEIDGYRFVPITDRKRLLEEGVVQNHCVYTLLNPCLMGETSVFTVEDKNGQVVATMEVQQEYGVDGLTHECIQLYGPNNSGVSRDLQAAGDRLIEMLDSGDLEPICLEEENDMAEILDNDDVEELADLQLVPFLTDAIYDAYGVIRDHLPMGITFSDIIQNTEGMFQLFSHSESGQAIQAIDRLATIYDLSTPEAVELAKAAPVRLVMENHRKLYMASHEAVHAKEQARIVHQHASNPTTLQAMATYAENYEDESFMPLWSFIEDNVESYPEGMTEDTFRRCLRSVIDTDCAERGLQDFASTLMTESGDKEREAKRHYELMVSYLPLQLSPEPLMQTFTEETQQRFKQLGLGEPEREQGITQEHAAMSL